MPGIPSGGSFGYASTTDDPTYDPSTHLGTTAGSSFVPSNGSYAAITSDVLSSRVIADANPRFTINADGTLEWGGGAGALDISLFRTAAPRLRTSTEFESVAEITAAAGTAGLVKSGRVGPASAAGLVFGTLVDTNLYRSAADKLATDDGLVLNNGALAGAASSAVSFYAGTGAPNNANGVNGDSYWRLDGGALTTIYQRRAGAWVGIL